MLVSDISQLSRRLPPRRNAFSGRSGEIRYLGPPGATRHERNAPRGRGEVWTMPYVTCPTCGERGKIPSNLIGARIKCRKCGVSFLVSPPAPAKAAGAATPAVDGDRRPSAAVEAQGIEVEGFDASSWSRAQRTWAMASKSPKRHATPTSGRTEASSAFVAAHHRHPPGRAEYKILTSKRQDLRREIRGGPPGGSPEPLRPARLGRQGHDHTPRQGIHGGTRGGDRRLARAVQGRRLNRRDAASARVSRPRRMADRRSPGRRRPRIPDRTPMFLAGDDQSIEAW